MANNPLLADAKETFDKCYETMVKKNADYAGDSDPFKNFLNSKVVGVSPQRGVLVRLMDKMSRIGNLIEGKAAKVKDETVDDTIDDAINYLVILKSLRKNKIQ